MNETVRPPRIVVMGVAGSGKTAVGSALAARLGLPFADADEFHPPANVAKMRAGRPLDDALRGHAPDLTVLHLAGDADVVTARVAARTHHFMPASLVSSRLELLEPLRADEAGVVADLTRPVDDLVDELSTLFRGEPAAAATGGTR
ncbi:MAG: gluconokinase [Blastococcus sp.]